jgi:hypothetical protein
MKELFCEECNKKLEFVFVHGYDFGDRLMEDVFFKVRVVNGKPECFGLKEECKPYMVQFNWEHWKKRCEEFCEDLDIATCPNCNYDVLVEDDETAASRPPPKPIGLKKAKDILGG